MKSLKDFKYGSIIPNVDIKKGKNSPFFGEITIKAIPPIYLISPYNKNCKTRSLRFDCKVHQKLLIQI